MQYIRWFEKIGIDDIPQVGGKNASLGQMIQGLKKNNILVPDGFAITADAYRRTLEANQLIEPIKAQLARLTDYQNFEQLKQVAAAIRTLISSCQLPASVAQEIIRAYHELSARYQQDNVDVAVRSSATAEDLPHASFAGQQESYVHIKGDQQLLEACIKCMASLFTDRAIVYREQQGFDHFFVALSIGVQKMVRADLGCSGVAFSLEPESGFNGVVVINGSYGLGEMIVQGSVIPDEFMVFKPTLAQGYRSIVQKKCGDKKAKLIYAHDAKQTTQQVQTTEAERNRFCLTDDEIIELAGQVVVIENYYTALKNHWCPMDVEWAKDGIDGKLYIVQARPETIHGSGSDLNKLVVYQLQKNPEELQKRLLVTGQSIGQRIVSGCARVIRSIDEISHVQDGDILVTTMTDPDWVPVMKKVKGIVTVLGGRTCHAAIVSRELQCLAIVGAQGALEKISSGAVITLDASQGSIGYVYDGNIPYTTHEVAIGHGFTSPISLMVNMGQPDQAFQAGRLPVAGVGLARTEFIIAHDIQIHPMALVHPDRVLDAVVKNNIVRQTVAYADGKTFFIQKLAQGIGTIAAAFYPRPVVVRFSDFKSNEYRNLIGGIYFEQNEANPMIGFRGASRYYNPAYQEAFALECAAVKYARDTMGLTNIMTMIPFVRTVDEARKVIDLMASHELKSQENFNIMMMCEIPSNALLIEQFSKYFDGFSIGSNDLTQLTLGIDRDSSTLAHLFDERDPAVKQLIVQAINGAHVRKKKISICGQGPSDYPDFADFLIKNGIDALSLNTDAVLPFMMRYSSGNG